MSSSTSPSQRPSSGHLQNPALDRSQSAPATMQQASTPEQCQGQPGFQELPGPSSQAEGVPSAPHQVHPHPLPAPSNSTLPPMSSPRTEGLPECNPPAVEASSGTQSFEEPEGEVQPRVTELDAESDGVENSSMLSQPEELSPIQPMEQEMDRSDTAGATETCPSTPDQQSQEGEERSEHQQLLRGPLSLSLGSCPADSAVPGNVCVIPNPDSAEMELPAASQDTGASERDQPEGERCPSSDSIPSLAAALLELHELLVSNSRTQSIDRSASCSPSQPFRQDADGLDDNPSTLTPENTQPTPSTAITAGAEPCDAKANHAAVSDEGPSKCLMPDLPGQDEHLGRDMAETVEEQGALLSPVGSWERRADQCGQDEAGNVSMSGPEPVDPSAIAGDLEFREPPEGQQGRGVADGRASGSNTPDTLGLQTEHTLDSPLPMIVGSPVEVSNSPSPSDPPLQALQPTSPAPQLSAPHPFTEQFPAEHIQRIQAAGFSAREAAEALEQAHGIVELALLALLARNITVPT
ncbi:protein DDI1 homolog 2 isoform X1 [Myripristis murdjan]|uniref:protein DDI1 homolog 2 isoform X1 n=1 Tax=Myripristis murdjan TaxID=586833 RepID=UPI001175E4C9|nr:cell surface glycoprotein 1-like isoform X1 [Myripristis murdjan]